MQRLPFSPAHAVRISTESGRPNLLETLKKNYMHSIQSYFYYYKLVNPSKVE